MNLIPGRYNAVWKLDGLKAPLDEHRETFINSVLGVNTDYDYVSILGSKLHLGSFVELSLLP